MSDWLSYSLRDLLMFSPRVYYRLVEHYNEAVWPLQILALLLGLVVLYLLMRPEPFAGRVIWAILGLAWIWTGWGFVWERFATINWPVAYLVPLFICQGLGLIWFGTIRSRLNVRAQRNLADWLGILTFAAVLTLYPLISVLMDRGWKTAETFGLMPDPTALATMAVLVLARGWMRWVLMIVPMLSCAIAAITLGTMEEADYLVPAVGAIGFFLLAIASNLTESRMRQAG